MGRTRVCGVQNSPKIQQAVTLVICYMLLPDEPLLWSSKGRYQDSKLFSTEVLLGKVLQGFNKHS